MTTDQNLIFLFHKNLLTSTTFENDCIFDDLIIILHVDFILTILFETMIFFPFIQRSFMFIEFFFLMSSYYYFIPYTSGLNSNPTHLVILLYAIYFFVFHVLL